MSRLRTPIYPISNMTVSSRSLAIGCNDQTDQRCQPNHSVSTVDAKESKNDYWMKLGREEIERSLELEQSKRAKNVILFLGDGMGISTITSAR